MSIRNRKLSAVRAALHDLTCQSDGCHGDNAHARRTQHGRAVLVVDAEYQITEAIKALHEIAHPTCDTAPDETHFRISIENPAYLSLLNAAQVS